FIGDGAPNSLGEMSARVLGRARQQDHELFAAIASRDIAVANDALDPPRDLTQHLVADEMPVTVVDALEMIDVDHEAGQRLALAPAARELLAEAAREVAAIVPTRQRIREAAANEPRLVDGVLDREGRDRREVLEKIGRVLFREAIGAIAAHVEAADERLAAQQRQQR